MQPAAGELTRDEQKQLDRWLLDFERSWDEGKLARRVAEFPVDGVLRYTALRALIKADLRHHWNRGSKKALEDYLRAYPELGTPETVPLELIQAEMQARRKAGASVSWADLSGRFPKQTDQLRRGMAQLWQQPADTASPTPAAQTNAELSVPDAEQQTLRPTPTTGPEPPPNPPNPPKPPQLTAVGPSLPEDRYEIIKILGRGAMGTVYLARDIRLDRQVALKVPHFLGGETPDMIARFHREARAAATLHHRNICPVYDVGEANGTPYLTMAYIEGLPLGEVLRKHPTMPQRRAVEIVYKLARALAEAHQRGVIHRDLKPSNVMVDREGEPVLMDFGLARRTGQQDVRLTREGSVLGTPAYMSPEQVNGELDTMGPPTDIYSLGVIFYELLTGQVPFQGSLAQVLSRILTEKPRPPRELRPDLDPALETICLRAISSRPEDRYASMADFAQALDAQLVLRPKPSPDVISKDSHPVIDHTGTEVIEGSVPGKEIPLRAPRRWAGMVLVGGAAAVFGVLAFFVWQVLQKDETPQKTEPVAVAIEWTPKEATLYLDGNKQPPSADGEYRLTPGKHRVELKLAQYRSVSTELVVPPGGKKEPFRYKLDRETEKPVFFDVTVTPDPLDASVLIEGQPERKGVARLKLEAGEYKVHFACENFKAADEILHVGPNRPNVLEVELTRTHHWLKVETRPRQGATVSINGLPQAKPTPGPYRVPVGKKSTLLVTLPGYEPKEVEVMVRADQAPSAEQVELAPTPPLVGTKYALLIGVRASSPKLPDFVHAEPDVVELGRLLVVGGYSDKNVVVMTQKLGEANPALRPTAAEIDAQYKALTRKCKRPDSILVALIGHAVQFTGDSECYFCPAAANLGQRATLLSLGNLYRDLHKKCEAEARLLLLDCWRHDMTEPPALPAGVSRGRPNRFLPDRGPVRWVSCAAGKRGYEDPQQEVRHGAFMAALLRSLRQPFDKPGQLLASVRERVADLTLAEPGGPQQPELLEGDLERGWFRLNVKEVLAAYRRGCDLVEEASRLPSRKEQLEKYRAAIAAFDVAVKEDERFVDAYVQRAAAHYRCGEFEAAIADCNAALKRDRNNAMAHSHRAEALTRLKRYEEALTEHEQAIALDPAYAQAYNTRGQTLFADGQLNLAINDFSEAISRNPRLKFALHNRAWAYLQLKKPLIAQAIDDTSEALRIDPKFVKAYFVRGRAREEAAKRSVDDRKVNYEAAQRDLSEAIALDSNFAKAFEARSRVRGALGDKKGAAADDKKHKELTKTKAP